MSSSELYDVPRVDPNVLRPMLETLRGASPLYQPSPFWERLASEHVAQLEQKGFDNFKRTINLRYFSWGILGIFAHQMAPLAWWWLRKGHGNPLASKIVEDRRSPEFYRGIAAKIYAVYIALLYQRVRQEDASGLFRRCTESLVGNPIRVAVDGEMAVTQDLCNSIHEYIHATQSAGLPGPLGRVLEIGAGYGRLADVFLQAEPKTKYWIVDIPPALYVSQKYLSTVYPGKKIFTFRPFDRFSDVESEVNDSDICFFLSNQIEMLPNKSVDLTVCISNLHEMTKEQIAHYFRQIDRLTRSQFYTKQWLRSRATENGFRISQHDYPVPANWQVLFHARHQIQSWFFEAAYKIT